MLPYLDSLGLLLHARKNEAKNVVQDKNFSGIFLIKELNIFSLMVMYQNDLIIFSSDNYKCNSPCHFHMFIYFYVSIFISLTNIYPL